jgi:hypothetical protein
MRIGLILLALLLGSCAAIPTYDDPKRVARIDKLREARDLCLVESVHMFDDGTSDPAKIGNYVAMACNVQTGKLVDLAIPYSGPKAREAFQEEAARRATGYVQTSRRIEGDAVDRQRMVPQQPTPLQ